MSLIYTNPQKFNSGIHLDGATPLDDRLQVNDISDIYISNTTVGIAGCAIYGIAYDGMVISVVDPNHDHSKDVVLIQLKDATPYKYGSPGEVNENNFTEYWTVSASGNVSFDTSVIDASINRLESTTSTLNINYTNLNGKVNTLDSSVNILDSDINNIQTDITSIKQKNISQDSSLNTLDSDINNIQTDITSIKQKNISQDSSLNTLDSSIRDIQTDITSIKQKNISQDSSLNILDSSIRDLYNKPEPQTSPVYQKAGQSGYVLGDTNDAPEENAFAEGYSTISLGISSHSEGNNTYSMDRGTHTEGHNTYAIGRASHAEGYVTWATGVGSHTEGCDFYDIDKNDLVMIHPFRIIIYNDRIELANEGDINIDELYFRDVVLLDGDPTTSNSQPLFPLKILYYNSDNNQITIQYQDEYMNGEKIPILKPYMSEEGTTLWCAVIKSGAQGDLSHSEGYLTSALERASHSEGVGTNALGVGTHAEGNNKYHKSYEFKVYSTEEIPDYSDTDTLELEILVDMPEYLRELDSEELSNLEITLSNGTSIAKVPITNDNGNKVAIDYFLRVIRIEGIQVGESEDGYKIKLVLQIDKNTEKINGSVIAGCTIDIYISGAFGIGSHTEGCHTRAFGPYSHAEGYNTYTTNVGEHATGTFNKSNDGTLFSVGFGELNERANAIEITSTGHVYIMGLGEYYGQTTESATSLQDLIQNSGTNYITHLDSGYVLTDGDNGNSATGYQSFAQGSFTTASGSSSHAEGSNTTASGSYSHAENYHTQATGDYSHAEGKYTIASGSSSHTEGDSTTASGGSSHAEGRSTTASGTNSHTEGNNTMAFGTSSHAEGNGTIAYGNYSHAEGSYGSTKNIDITRVYSAGDYYLYLAELLPSGTIIECFDEYEKKYYSMVEYSYTEEVGEPPMNDDDVPITETLYISYLTRSFPVDIENGYVICYYDNASGNYSHIEGYATQARNIAEHASGKYNKSSPNITQFSVGVGTSQTDRKNAFEITKDGSVYIKGVGNYNGKNVDTATDIQTILSGDSQGIDYNTLLNKPITYINNQGYAVGNTNTASGFSSFAEGSNTTASGILSHAEGYYTTASGNCAHAEGYDTSALGQGGSHAEGYYTIASGYNGSHAEGEQTTASGYSGAHAEGCYTTASGYYGSHAEGYYTTASGNSAHAEGYGTTASYNNAHAEGEQTIASGYSGAHAEGYSTTASGVASHAEGYSTTASGVHSHAEGYDTSALGQSGSHAEGEYTIASGNSGSHAEGSNTIASGNSGSHAEGYSTTASGSSAHAEGYSTTASGIQSHAEGSNTIASGSQSHAEGAGYKYTSIKVTRAYTANSNTIYISSDIKKGVALALDSNKYAIVQNCVKDTTNNDYQVTLYGSFSTDIVVNTSLIAIYTVASGEFSHAEGSCTIASGYYSHAEGRNTTASSDSAHAEGLNTIADGVQSHAEGSNTTASGQVGSHAEGDHTNASGHNGSHAEGRETTASGQSSHAEGSNTTASSGTAHAEGYYTTASGGTAHAEGSNTIASGSCSHAEGKYTQTTNEAEHAEGSWNLSTPSITKSSIGIGDSETNRKNAFEVTIDGSIYIKNIGNYNGTNVTDSSVKCVQEVIAEMQQFIDTYIANH